VIDLLYLFADDLAEFTADSSDVGRVTVTAGEPAAQAGDDCPPAIWVWAAQMEDGLEFDPGCTTRTEVRFNYRIDVCYQTTAEDETDAIHNAAADTLYQLMTEVWCGLVAAKDAGTLMDLGTCDRVRINPLVTGQRQGSTVSASGGVTFDYAC